MSLPADCQSRTVGNDAVHEVRGGSPLSEADLKAYRDDGVILIRQAIPEAVLAGVDEDLLDRIKLLQSHHSIETQSGLNAASTVHANLTELYARLPEAQSALYDVMSLSPSIANAAALPGIHGYVKQLLSPIFAIHHRRILLMSPPENEWHLPVWHQDWYYNEGPATTMTLYAPLQRTTSFNGGLKLALGEWQNGFIEHGAHDHGVRTKWQSLPPERVAQFGRVVTPELERGDVLFFNSLVPHSAQLNRSANVRLVINLRFQDLVDREFTEQYWRTGAITHARKALASKSE